MWRGIAGISTVSDRSVALTPLYPCQFQEMPRSVPLRGEHLALLSATPSNPSPTANHGHLAEQGGLQRQRIIARHVFRCVDALAIKPEIVECHGENMTKASALVQRQF